jgi:hypothetical protein
MGPLKLRRFAASEQQRLGFLLAKAKENVASESEEIELVQLLKEAQQVSDWNARLIIELRGSEPSKKNPGSAKRQAKSS